LSANINPLFLFPLLLNAPNGGVTKPGLLKETTKYASAFITIANKKSARSNADGNGTRVVSFPSASNRWSKVKCNADQMMRAFVMSD
jgi:hypothetical protein